MSGAKLKSLFAAALLAGAGVCAADETPRQQRRLFWGQDSNPQHACDAAGKQARRYLDGRLGTEPVAFGECHCPKPDPGGAPANSLLETADHLTPSIWRCMVELRYTVRTE